MLPQNPVEDMLFQLVNGSPDFQLAVLSQCPMNYESIVRNDVGHLPDAEHPSSIAPICYPTSSEFSQNQSLHDDWWTTTAGLIWDEGLKQYIDASDGYSPSALSSTIPCPAGTFANDTGLVYEWQCASCPPGMYCDGDVKPCLSGFTSEPGAKTAQDCLKCADGLICKPTDKPNDLSFPTRCPLGTYWTMKYSSTTEQNEYECIDCPPGHKCNFDSVKKICPDGTFQSHKGQMDCERCDPGLGERCENAAVIKSDFVAAKCSTGIFEEMSTFLSMEHTGRTQCVSKCKKDPTCMGFHVQAANPDLNLPVMCITKHFKTSNQIGNEICGSSNDHGLSKKMEKETEIEKYSKFIQDRNQKIDLWHRQFENMTIEENGIIKTVSQFEIRHQNSPDNYDARFNMIFADAAVEKLINEYKGGSRHPWPIGRGDTMI